MGILDSSVTTGPMGEETGDRDRYYHWSLEIAWLPHRCKLTNKLLWLKLAWRGSRRLGSGDTAVTTVRWHCAEEHMIWLLKR